jgi:hypothetical protein
MSQRRFVSVRVAFAAVAMAPLVQAADASLGQDLKATIVLQGQPCDQIVSTQRNGDSDYSVSCKDGNRYHVFVSAQGRVVVQKQ